MKYRIEIQQVYGTAGVAFDTDAQWLETDVKPRGLAAAQAALRAQVEKYKTGAPHRLVAIGAARVVIETLAYESPYAQLAIKAAETVEPVVELCGDNATVEINGKQLTFRLKFEDDTDAGLPWEECDGHGPVSDWTRRDKRPGEFVLKSQYGEKRYYDYAEACRIALRDRWDAKPYNTGNETKRQQAAKAALSDYNYLRAFCNDQWSYVGVVVTLLDEDGEETNVSDSLWCLETYNDYHLEAAREVVAELAQGYGSSWGLVSKETYDYLPTTEAN